MKQIVSVVAGVALGIVSNYLYDYLKKIGLIPNEPTVKFLSALTALVFALIFLAAWPDLASGDKVADLPTPTPSPTLTPLLPTVTQTPEATRTPTHTPEPTRQPQPTYTPLPTYTPFPTSTSEPVAREQRVYLVDSPHVYITYISVSGLNQHREYISEVRAYPSESAPAREFTTMGSYWQGLTNTWIILSNDVQIQCQVMMGNGSGANPESYGIYGSGNGIEGGGPGSNCSRQR